MHSLSSQDTFADKISSDKNNFISVIAGPMFSIVFSPNGNWKSSY